MNSLELRVPPLAVVLLAGLLMGLIAVATPPLALPPAVRWGGAAAGILLGILAALAGVLTFRRARTTVNPLRPEAASALVANGIYRCTRNPMYLGMLLVLTGWAVYLARPWALLVLPAFVVYMNRFQIGPEERALEAIFGAEFDAYRNRVRRWL